MSLQSTIPTTASSGKRNALLVAGGLGLAGVGLAAGLMLRNPAPEPVETVVSTSALSSNSSKSSKSTTAPVGNDTKSAAAPHNKQAAAGGSRAAEAAPLQTQRAAVCAHCGVVEGVRTVQRKGEGSGVGAVAGGVVGAVVGNQMGGGDGRKAMTVLGAIGGGLAGNEIEKRSKSTTEYEVRVRMDDGTLRTFTSSTSPTPGTPVTVNDKGFQVVQREGNGAPRVVRTAS